MMFWLPLLFGVSTLILGYFIAFQGLVEVLAGYDSSKVKDPKALGRFTGSHLMLLGLIGIFTGILGAVFPDAGQVLNIVFFITIALISIRLAIGERKY